MWWGCWCNALSSVLEEGFVAGVLGADGCGADPLVLDINAHLQYNLDGGRSADGVIVNDNAAFFPCMDHIILADPFVCVHNAIVRLLVKIDDVLEADVEAFVMTAETAEPLAMFALGELSDERTAIIHRHGISFEEINQILVADIVPLNINAEAAHDFVHIFFANELLCYFETATVFESITHVLGTGDFTVNITETAMRDLLLVFILQVLDHDRIARADFKTVRLDTLAQEK